MNCRASVVETLLLQKNVYMSGLTKGKSFSINNFSENLSARIFQNFSDKVASLSEEPEICPTLASSSVTLPEKKDVYIS